ncbi:MAG TPA: MBL fold metallo-hydrolase [Planctomycetota bacterium]|nr:MBL fold metallo-hydrolase [Planctomycetota bacterium]
MAKPVVPLDVDAIRNAGGAMAYVVTDPASRDAAVVDPVLEDVGEVLRVLSGRRATLRWIVDTHAHGDHLSGAALLHHKTGAEVVASSASDVRSATRRVAEGDVLPLGELKIVVRAAPGVSPDAIVLQGPGVLFTGDTLLVGTIGVRDAPGSDGGALYETMQRIFDPLPEDTVVHPGHDDMGRSKTTIKAEKRGNRWLREKDRDAFLARWASDPRVVAREAAEILSANREGVTTPPRDVETLQVHGRPAGRPGLARRRRHRAPRRRRRPDRDRPRLSRPPRLPPRERTRRRPRHRPRPDRPRRPLQTHLSRPLLHGPPTSHTVALIIGERRARAVRLRWWRAWAKCDVPDGVWRGRAWAHLRRAWVGRVRFA